MVNDDHTRCEDCGVRMTAVSKVQNLETQPEKMCGCQAGFYNFSDTLPICFHGSYDEARVAAGIGDRQEQQHECGTCPTDITDTGCITCLDGVTSISPGFIVTSVASSMSRRALLDGDTNVQSVFRCHLEIDLAIKRCPGCKTPPCECAVGYTVLVCNECTDGFGMSATTRTCELCEGTGYNTESLGILCGILVGVAIVFGVIGKVWKAFPLKHLLRCGFQPARILITYSEIPSRIIFRR